MTSTETNFYYAFYAIGFTISILTGLFYGFTGNSHTPPIPFAIEFFTLLFGFVFMLIDAAKRKSLKVHLFGLAGNGLIMAIIITLALM